MKVILLAALLLLVGGLAGVQTQTSSAPQATQTSQIGRAHV